MKSEVEIRAKRLEIRNNLLKLYMVPRRERDHLQIEFHKNNLAFIDWALEIETSKDTEDFLKALRWARGGFANETD